MTLSGGNPATALGDDPHGVAWTAIVLAGQRPEDAFADSMGAPAKALIVVNGEPMLARVVRTLLAVRKVARVVVLTQAPERLAPALPDWFAREPRVTLARSTDGISASIARALDEPGLAPLPVLVTTADHPLLTPEIVDEFLDGGGGSDLAIGFVSRRTLIAAYPGSRRTWLRFADEGYTGANLFALRGRAALIALRFWSRAERDRKRWLRLLWHFGPYLFVRVVTRTLTLHQALQRAGARLGTRIVPVVLTTPEAGIDVDKRADLLLAEQVLASREATMAIAPSVA